MKIHFIMREANFQEFTSVKPLQWQFSEAILLGSYSWGAQAIEMGIDLVSSKNR